MSSATSTSSSTSPSLFARLASWCHRRRWFVVVGWLLLAIGGGALLGAVGSETRTEFSLPDVESRRGIEILDDHFGGQGAGWNGSIVFRAEQGVDDPAVRTAMEALFADVATLETVRSVVSPYSTEGERQVSRRGDEAGRIAYAVVEFPSNQAAEPSREVGEHIREVLPEVPGLQIELGGEVFAEWEEPTAELVGLAFAIVILILAFGSVLAMGLPIGVGVAGVGVGTILGGFLSHLLEVPEFAQMLGVMIGLGVGIDYALFIVTRFREARRAGRGVERSIVIALDTAGRAVAFAGATVVISLLGMMTMQLAFITGMAVSAATVVAVTMAASLTLLPALVSITAHKIEITRWRGVIASGFVSITLLGVAFSFQPFLLGLPLAVVILVLGLVFAPLKRPLPPRRHRPMEETLAYRWSRFVQHRPWPIAIVATIVLVVLALPVFGLRLGFSDEGNYAAHTTTKKAYDLLTDGFGPGYNGPLVLAAELPPGLDPASLGSITEVLAGTEGIAQVSPAVTNGGEAPTAALWQVFPTTSPQDVATTELVKRLRGDVLPEVAQSSGLDIVVAGSVAINIDFSDYLAARMPYFLGAVLTLSFLLLMAVFRSVLVPLKAVIMNLLGIGAAYGIVVVAFQWGWAGPLLGVSGGPIEPFLPMMLFAIVFGLSMDYEVFLLSRVKEEYDRTGDNYTAVANGLAATARVITAAAMIMVVVFGSFMLGEERVIKIAGLGLAVAVLLDATVIRMLLVPATMELLGDRNWWLPRWLDRLLPKIDVEGHMDDTADELFEGDPALDDEGELQPV